MPTASFVLRGLPTLAIRMDRHAASATALAGWPERQDAVAPVVHPSLEFLDALTVPERTTPLGSVHTIVVHPPSTPHRPLEDAALVAAGSAAGLLRISVRLEEVDDLGADFARALETAASVAGPDAIPPQPAAAPA